MRLALISLLFAVFFASSALAWSPEDHEIFQLNDDVLASEGANTTFYSFVGVKSRKASLAEIKRSYRKQAAILHPDKARSTYISQYKKSKGRSPSNREITTFMKEANKRFARLGVVADILRGPDRDRYDFFLNNGFPTWRGTGYYYQRYRPGAGTVLVGLFIVLGGFAHYGALFIGWKRQREFAEKFVKDARKLAWGTETVVPGLDAVADGIGTSNGNAAAAQQQSTIGLNRKQRRAQEKEGKKSAKKGVAAGDSGTSTPAEPAEPVVASTIHKRRVVAENGKILIVDSIGNVFLEETNDEGETNEFLIDVNEIQKPSLKDTVLVQAPIFLWNLTAGKLIGVKKHIEEDTHDQDEDDSQVTVTSPSVGAAARRRKIKTTKR